jgi:hypothetical protein
LDCSNALGADGFAVTTCSPTPLQHSQIFPIILPFLSQAAQVIRSVASTTQVPAQAGQVKLVVTHSSLSPLGIEVSFQTLASCSNNWRTLQTLSVNPLAIAGVFLPSAKCGRQRLYQAKKSGPISSRPNPSALVRRDPGRLIRRGAREETPGGNLSPDPPSWLPGVVVKKQGTANRKNK